MTNTYLDAASACPPHPVALRAFEAASAEGWTDPHRRYTSARRARQLLDAARESVARTLRVAPAEVRFAPSGTQAVHTGVLGVLAANQRAGNLFVHSEVEHASVRHAGVWHRDRGGELSTAPVDRMGRVDVDELARIVSQQKVALVAVQSANHEVGTVQPVQGAATACGDVPLFVDAAQSLGRARVPDGWSVMAGSARKWGGPAGVGILVVRRGTRWRSPWPEDVSDPDAPGTASLPAIVAAAASLRAVAEEREAEDTRLRRLTARIRGAAGTIPYLEVVGDPDDRLPHIVTLSYPFDDAEPLAEALNVEGFAVSAGSSCTSSTLRPSHVLEAMGVLSHGNIRVSLHRGTTEEEVDRFLETLPQVVARARQEAGVAL